MKNKENLSFSESPQEPLVRSGRGRLPTQASTACAILAVLAMANAAWAKPAPQKPGKAPQKAAEAVFLICPDEYPESVQGESIDPKESCKHGRIRIDCDNPKIDGAGDVSPRKIALGKGRTAVELPLFPLTNDAIAVQCKGDTEPRNLIVHPPSAPSAERTLSELELEATAKKDPEVIAAKKVLEEAEESITEAYKGYPKLNDELRIAREKYERAVRSRIKGSISAPVPTVIFVKLKEEYERLKARFDAKKKVIDKYNAAEKAHAALLDIKIQAEKLRIAEAKAGYRPASRTEASPAAAVQAPSEPVVAKPVDKPFTVIESVEAGIEFPLISNGDNMVSGPGFSLETNIGFPRRTIRQPLFKLFVEVASSPLRQLIGRTSFVPVDPSRRLDGRIVSLAIGTHGTFDLWENDNIRLGARFVLGPGAAFVHIDGGNDVAVATSDNISLANVAPVNSVGPYSSVSASLIADFSRRVFVTLGISGFMAGPVQLQAGIPQNHMSPLFNLASRITVGGQLP